MKRAGAVVALVCLPATSFHIGSIALPASQARSPVAQDPVAEALRLLQASAEVSPQIQFDTRGVEFRPWIRRLIVQVKRNWLVPYRAMSLNGHVAITFNVHKDGSVTDVTVTAPSPIEDFNAAARGALAVSNAVPPLPAEYPAEKAFFTITFFYNESPPGVSLPPRPPAVSWPPRGIYVAGSEGVTSPRVVHEEKAQYTADARREKIEGSVLLEGIVQPDGSVTFLHVIHSLDPTLGLDREALRAAAAWRFEPGTRMGEPVPVVTILAIPFTLKE